MNWPFPMSDLRHSSKMVVNNLQEYILVRSDWTVMSKTPKATVLSYRKFVIYVSPLLYQRKTEAFSWNVIVE